MTFRFHAILFATLIALPVPELLAQTRQVSVRGPGRISTISRSMGQPAEMLSSGHEGCGCQSGGCGGESSCGGCGVSSCLPCCCLFQRLAARISNTLNCLFPCDPCGNACAPRSHGCCFPGLISNRFRRDGCSNQLNGMGCSGCSGCSGCGSTSGGMNWDPSASDPFMDDAEVPHNVIAPPVPPKDARLQRLPNSPKVAVRTSTTRAVAVSTSKSKAPRQLVGQQAAKPMVVKKGSKTAYAGKTTSILKTSGPNTSSRKVPTNPLRRE